MSATLSLASLLALVVQATTAAPMPYRVGPGDVKIGRAHV